MTIDEIIDQMEEIAVYQEVEYGEKTFEMYMQVIDLLKELKLLREKLPQGHTSWDKGYDAGYSQAIDDFMSRISKEFGTDDEVMIEHFDLKQIANEMKG